MNTKDEAHKNVLIRLPVSVLEHIDAAAKAGFRSRTAEVVKRLLETMEGESIDEHGVIVRRVASVAK